MLQLPALVLSVLLSALYATLFHLWQGKGIRHLLFYWLASLIGFAAGQFIAGQLRLIPWTIGQVHVVEASAGSLLFILAAHWLRPQARIS